VSVLVLSHEQVTAALDPVECREAMAAILVAQARGEVYVPLRSVMRAPGAAGLLGLMPTWRGGERPLFAVKSVCLMPGNPARGLDAHQGIVTLSDGETGVPIALLDASSITAIRTAAVTALATRTLARDDAAVLAILGSGVQARAHVRALAALHRFSTMRVYSPTAAHVHALIEECGPSLTGATLSAAASAEEAVRGADVVVTVTNAREPVLRRDWLAAGVHVNAVGASAPDWRELDTATVAACALFADSRESLRHEAGEFRLAVQEGLISDEGHVRAELGEVIAGMRPGRADAQELTLFRSLGIAAEDLAAAELAVSTARRLGLGTEVEL
jgi:ornithine cyclodeaminase/alanine dehydrogenase-like protein (mu-crystallin family)